MADRDTVDMAESALTELDALLLADIREAIPAAVLQPIISSPPFIQQPALINARDIGAVPGSGVPSGRIYRCAVLDNVAADPGAVAWLAANVTRIFDLRGSLERDAAPEPVIPGVESVWLDTEGPYHDAKVAEFIEGDGVPGWRVQFMSIANVYKPIFREVLKHVRDRPNDAFLFHCTGTMPAGRDRTGVLAGMLHHLAGTSPADAERDYMLSRIGLEPARDKLLAYVMGAFGVTSTDAPGLVDMISLRPSYWNAFLEDLRDEYGGWDGYVTRGLGFSEEDARKIRENLRST
ncbi:protein-tyrosine phosphatase, active site protein [Paramyrothecium foliicola]|nr:protein-tyrosine phosphatase, active site protein [Paramyrothecium foliicola]